MYEKGIKISITKNPPLPIKSSTIVKPKQVKYKVVIFFTSRETLKIDNVNIKRIESGVLSLVMDEYCAEFPLDKIIMIKSEKYYI